MERTIPAPLRDDRFDQLAAAGSYLVALERSGTEITGFIGGWLERDELHLECLSADDSNQGGAALTDLYTALKQQLLRSGSPIPPVITWARPVTACHEAFAVENGLTPFRRLHQLRCTLPLAENVKPPPLTTRAFEPGRDDEDLLNVNNRAFADHPDQGRHTLETLQAIFAESWFRAEGLRLYHDPESGDLAGFCWTKVHEQHHEHDGALGEIFVIGIDPDHHGQGLGVPMTAAGLSWLAGQGLTTGMLYVEADNAPALRTYEKLGFVQHRTDAAWIEHLTDADRGLQSG